ncbi:MAG: hypothetical protein WC916_01710 [Candidatus Woesearchaeota archaeon]
MDKLKISLRSALTSDPNVKLYAEYFHAGALDRINSADIPKQKFCTHFQEINDIDYICQQAGGKELFTERKIFSWEESKTIYKVGNVLVINESFGYHPDRATKILMIEGEFPDTDITERFKKFYSKEPTRIQSPETHLTVDASYGISTPVRPLEAHPTIA